MAWVGDRFMLVSPEQDFFKISPRQQRVKKMLPVQVREHSARDTGKKRQGVKIKKKITGA
jgi:hypothetical protein